MFLRINDTIIPTDNIGHVLLADLSSRAIIYLRDGRQFVFDNEAADALRLYFDSTKDVVHLDKLFKHAT